MVKRGRLEVELQGGGVGGEGGRSKRGDRGGGSS